MAIPCWQMLQMKVLLQFLEDELYLPPQTIQLAHRGGLPLDGGEVGQIGVLLAFGPRRDHQSGVNPTALCGAYRLSLGNDSHFEIPGLRQSFLARQQRSEAYSFGVSLQRLAHPSRRSVCANHHRIAVLTHRAQVEERG